MGKETKVKNRESTYSTPIERIHSQGTPNGCKGILRSVLTSPWGKWQPAKKDKFDMFLKHVHEQTPTSWERNTNNRARLPILLMYREKGPALMLGLWLDAGTGQLPYKLAQCPGHSGHAHLIREWILKNVTQDKTHANELWASVFFFFLMCYAVSKNFWKS